VLSYLAEVEPLMEPTGGYPVVMPRQPERTKAAPANPSGGQLSYLAKVEPLMEPTGGYPVVMPRQPERAKAAPATPSGGLPPPPAPTTYSTPLAGDPARPRRRQWLVVIALIAAIAVFAAVLLALQHRQPTGPVSLPLPAALASAPRSASPLSAGYETVGHTGPLGLTGYRGRVTITNPASRPANGWEVTIVLPGGQNVFSAAGAGYRQAGAAVLFTPTGATSGVPAGGTVTFSFNVSSLVGGPPIGCAIDNNPCA
jgi:hypothetical protein